ncbi:MAG: response regulator [Planctomycetes bacterium]|nr:response regulator [Planctomycetota bacterium]
MIRALTTVAIALLLALNLSWAGEEGYQNLLDAPPGKSNEQETKITESFRAALQLLKDAAGSRDDAVKKKKFEEARIAIEKVMSLDPNASLARQLRDMVKDQLLAQILLEAPPNVIDKVKEFLTIAEKGRRNWIRDPKRITELIKDLLSGEFDKKWIALTKLNAAGQHAAPQLVEALKTGDRDARTNVSMTLISSGPSVVQPLNNALKTSDEDLKQEIVFILDRIGDAHALPGLAAATVNSSNQAVRKDARKAIEKIVAGEPLKSAPVYYLDQATAYYQERFEVLQRASDDYIIWDWDGKAQALKGRRVPEYAFYLEMAEKLCYDAIAIAGGQFDAAHALLICTYFQQLHTCDNLVAAAKNIQGDTLTEEEIAGIKARRDRIVEILRTAPALGKQSVYRALKLALADGNVAVAVSCSDALRRLGSDDDLPLGSAVPVGEPGFGAVSAHADPLVAALYSDNKFVSYHAAATLCSLSNRTFAGMDRVIPTVCQALGERGARVALVADSDLQVINQLKADLKDDGYIVDTATSPMEALNVGYAVPMKDVLIVDASYSNAIGTFIVDFRSRNVPIILLTDGENVAEARAVYEGKVNGFVSKPVDAAELRSVMLKALRTLDEDTAQSVALSMNHLAAKALANVDVSKTALQMEGAVDALLGALDLPDHVRLEAMKALSNIAPASETAQAGLALVAGDGGNSLEARLASLEALAAIAVKHGAITAGVEDLTEKLLLDKAPLVRSAAARVIGAATQTSSPVERLIGDPKWVIDQEPQDE